MGGIVVQEENAFVFLSILDVSEVEYFFREIGDFLLLVEQCLISVHVVFDFEKRVLEDSVNVFGACALQVEDQVLDFFEEVVDLQLY